MEITNITLENNTFDWNTAVYSKHESVYSPFYYFLSKGIPFTFYDTVHNFSDEFEFNIFKSYTFDKTNHPLMNELLSSYEI